MGPEAPDAPEAQGARPPAVWLWLHDLLDAAAVAGAALLAQRLPLRAVPLPVALAGRWELAVDGRGTTARLRLPGAEPARLAGVIHTQAPVALPPQGADAGYKSAEWQALLTAWLHGLPTPVLNRPRPARAAGAHGPPVAAGGQALWLQRLARAGLPVRPWHAGRPGAATPAGDGSPMALWMVAGRQVVRAASPAAAAAAAAAEAAIDTAVGLSRPALHRRLAAVARAAGVDWLAVSAAPVAGGGWQLTGATPSPDLRAFGAAGCDALAAALRAARAADRAQPGAEAAAGRRGASGR
jgi:hypothetical protein